MHDKESTKEDIYRLTRDLLRHATGEPGLPSVPQPPTAANDQALDPLSAVMLKSTGLWQFGLSLLCLGILTAVVSLSPWLTRSWNMVFLGHAMVLAITGTWFLDRSMRHDKQLMQQ